MGSTLNEVKYASLLASTGATPPITLNELEMLRFNDLGFTTGTLNERLSAFLTAEGIPQGQLNERLYALMINRGFEGTLNEMLYQWWGGGAASNFQASQIIHWEASTTVQVQFSNPPTTIDAVNWSASINDVATTIVFDSVAGTIGTFTIGATIAGDVVKVSYATGGNTFYDGEELTPFTNVIASNTSDGALAWAAASSLYTLTDGASTVEDRFVLSPQLVGAGTPQFVTPDGLALPDFEGIYRQNESNEPSWHGGRKVTQLLFETEDLNGWLINADATITSGRLDPKGGDTAWSIAATAGLSANGFQVNQANGLIPENGDSSTSSVWVRRVAGTGVVRFACGRNYFWTDLTSIITTDWQRISVHRSTQTAGSSSFGFQLQSGGDEIEVWHPMDEKVNGQSNVAPSEYIANNNTSFDSSVTTTYSNLNGNTVLSNVVTEALGAPLAVTPSLYAAPAAENDLTWSRDLTDVAWSKLLVLTTYDQIGLTGEANTASLLDDQETGIAGYARRNPVIPSDTITRSIIFYIKKDTDQTRFPLLSINYSGTVRQVSLDTQTGASFSRLNSPVYEVVDAGDWWEVIMQDTNTNQTTSDLRIYPAYSTTLEGPTSATAIGSIIVGNAEVHANKTIDQARGLGPIFTTTAAVSQAAIDITFDLANHNDNQGAYYAEVVQFSSVGQNGSAYWQILGARSGWNGFLGHNTGNTLLAQATGAASTVPWVSTPNEQVRLACVYDAAVGEVVANKDGVYDPTPALTYTVWSSTRRIAAFYPNLGSHASAPALIRNIRRYDLPYTEGKAKIDELMAL